MGPLSNVLPLVESREHAGESPPWRKYYIENVKRAAWREKPAGVDQRANQLVVVKVMEHAVDEDDVEPLVNPVNARRDIACSEVRTMRADGVIDVVLAEVDTDVLLRCEERVVGAWAAAELANGMGPGKAAVLEQRSQLGRDEKLLPDAVE